MNKDFYHIHFSYFRTHHDAIFKRYKFTNPGAKFFYNVSLAFGFNAYVPRRGVWTTPWDEHLAVEPNNVMPQYDREFNKTFDQICDETALKIGQRIVRHDEKFIVPYSGGIDSTCIMAAIVRNLDSSLLDNITVSMSFDSIAENPYFYYNYICDKFKLHDSHEFDLTPLAEEGYRVIIGDQGDALFGTELGTKFYPALQYLSGVEHLNQLISDPNHHYSEFKELIIKYFNRCLKSRAGENYDKSFGEIYYNKLVYNIETSSYPIVTLHDFFWWIIFNIKYIHCALRAGGIQSTGRDRSKVFKTMVHWYGSRDFQKWSMVNNNNGQKINGSSQGQYKIAAKDYIYGLDNNDWYYYYKIKIPSKPLVVNRSYEHMENTFGLDTNYQMCYFSDPGIEDFFVESLRNFEL
jgi:hypothetical protein